jgi:hypothetical protein
MTYLPSTAGLHLKLRFYFVIGILNPNAVVLHLQNVMYNGIGLTTPRGRCVLSATVEFIMLIRITAVQMAMLCAISRHFVSTRRPQTELLPGV